VVDDDQLTLIQHPGLRFVYCITERQDRFAHWWDSLSLGRFHRMATGIAGHTPFGILAAVFLSRRGS
jgi:hypothetical protein